MRGLIWGTFPTIMPTCWPGSWGLTYHVDTNLSVKVAPVFYSYVGHGNASAGFYGPFVGQGMNGFTFDPAPTPTTTSGTVPGAFVTEGSPSATTRLASIIWPSSNCRWR